MDYYDYDDDDYDLSIAMAVIVPAATRTFVPWNFHTDDNDNYDNADDDNYVHDVNYDEDDEQDLHGRDEFTSGEAEKPFSSVETLGQSGGQADHADYHFHYDDHDHNHDGDHNDDHDHNHDGEETLVLTRPI